MPSSRRGVGEQDAEKTQLQWLMETLRKFGAPPLAHSLNEAAMLLGIGRTRLDRLISLGLIRAVHYEPGDHPKITRSELERFLSERQDASSPLVHGSPPTAKPRARTRGAAQRDVEEEIAKFDAATKKRR